MSGFLGAISSVGNESNMRAATAVSGVGGGWVVSLAKGGCYLVGEGKSEESAFFI